MPTHRFKIGSAVMLTSEERPSSKASRYIVEAQMPPVGTQLQYRIKSEAENFRRVVVEHQLASFSVSADPTPATTADGPPRRHPGEAD